MKDEYVILLVGVVAVCLSCAMLMDNEAVYENITGEVTGKGENEYTTMVAFSTGKTTGVVPVNHHDYWPNTTYGEVEVDMEEYGKYFKGDKVNLTRIVNTTIMSLR